MNEAILENYLDVIQGDDEPDYLTEGLREFVGKFNKQTVKRTMDKLHLAFSKGDAQSFEDVAKKTAQIGKLPKQHEVETYMKNLSEEHPDFGRSTELSKKVLKNTFKIRDKNKLAIMGNIVGMIAWVKSKGGRRDLMKETKTTLHDISSRVSSIYDTGFDEMDTSTPEEEEFKRKMIAQSKKQEKVEMIVVAILLGGLAAAVIWGGIALWGVATSPWVIALAAISAFGVMLFKILCALVGLAALTVIPIMQFIKAKG